MIDWLIDNRTIYKIYDINMGMITSVLQIMGDSSPPPPSRDLHLCINVFLASFFKYGWYGVYENKGLFIPELFYSTFR